MIWIIVYVIYFIIAYRIIKRRRLNFNNSEWTWFDVFGCFCSCTTPLTALIAYLVFSDIKSKPPKWL